MLLNTFEIINICFNRLLLLYTCCYWLHVVIVYMLLLYHDVQIIVLRSGFG